MKKLFLILILFLMFGNSCVYAYKKVNINAIIKELETDDQQNQIVYFRNEDDAELKNIAYLPKNAMVKTQICAIQKEKRWHKSAFALLKILNFTPEGSEESVDLSNDNIYLAARKYVPVDLPDAAGTGIELSATTAAAFFVPGVDVLYYFTKGAIKRENNQNWFKSGVSEAYDNSIFWFIEKGRPIILEEEVEVQLQSMSDKKISKVINKYNKN